MNKLLWLKSGIMSMVFLLMSLFINMPVFIQLPTPAYEHAKQVVSLEKTLSQAENNRQAAKLTNEQLIYLTKAFMNKLVQEIDDDYRVLHFNTKEELLDDFENVMSRDLAKLFVDFYYEENDGKLYIIPTETPPWFDEEKEYDMIQVNDYKVHVVQENDSVFYGQYTIELELIYTDQWRITDVVVK